MKWKAFFYRQQQQEKKIWWEKKLHRKIKKLGNENFFICMIFCCIFIFLQQVHIISSIVTSVLDLVYIWYYSNFFLSRFYGQKIQRAQNNNECTTNVGTIKCGTYYQIFSFLHKKK